MVPRISLTLWRRRLISTTFSRATSQSGAWGIFLIAPGSTSLFPYLPCRLRLLLIHLRPKRSRLLSTMSSLVGDRSTNRQLTYRGGTTVPGQNGNALWTFSYVYEIDPTHTSFAAASDCRAIAIYEYTS